MVEINNEHKESDSKSIDMQKPERRESDQQKKLGTKTVRENFDEIVTVHRDNVEAREKEPDLEQLVNSARNEDEQYNKHHKGFSIQRAWCCLRGRRTS